MMLTLPIRLAVMTGDASATLPAFQGTRSFLACTSFFADISTKMLCPILSGFFTQTLKAGGSVVGLVGRNSPSYPKHRAGVCWGGVGYSGTVSMRNGG